MVLCKTTRVLTIRNEKVTFHAKERKPNSQELLLCSEIYKKGSLNRENQWEMLVEETTHITTKEVIFKWSRAPLHPTWNGFGEFELIIRIKYWERENTHKEESYSSAQNHSFLDLKTETLTFFQTLRNSLKNRDGFVGIDLQSLKRSNFIK